MKKVIYNWYYRPGQKTVVREIIGLGEETSTIILLKKHNAELPSIYYVSSLFIGEGPLCSQCLI